MRRCRDARPRDRRGVGQHLRIVRRGHVADLLGQIDRLQFCAGRLLLEHELGDARVVRASAAASTATVMAEASSVVFVWSLRGLIESTAKAKDHRPHEMSGDQLMIPSDLYLIVSRQGR